MSNRVMTSAGLKSFVRQMCTKSPTAVGWWDGFTEYQKIIITSSMTMGCVGIYISVLEEKAAGWPKLKKRISGKPYLESWVLPWLTTKSTE